MYVLSKTKPWPEVYVGVYKTPKWYAKFQTVSPILMAAALGRETCQHAALVSSFYKLPALPLHRPLKLYPSLRFNCAPGQAVFPFSRLSASVYIQLS